LPKKDNDATHQSITQRHGSRDQFERHVWCDGSKRESAESEKCGHQSGLHRTPHSVVDRFETGDKPPAMIWAWVYMIAVFIFAGAVVVYILTQGMGTSEAQTATPVPGQNVIPGTNLISTGDIAMYAANAGWSGPDLQVAVAVALAESSGYADVTGDLLVTPGGSIGLWQINLKAHPQYTAAQLMDPQTNANAAYPIYLAAGGNFSSWSAYNNQAYSAYLIQAQSAVNA
jgi:hypothetical protein